MVQRPIDGMCSCKDSTEEEWGPGEGWGGRPHPSIKRGGAKNTPQTDEEWSNDTAEEGAFGGGRFSVTREAVVAEERSASSRREGAVRSSSRSRGSPMMSRCGVAWRIMPSAVWMICPHSTCVGASEARVER